MRKSTVDRLQGQHPAPVPGREAGPLRTTKEAAPHVRLSDRTLERYRVTGEGPEFLKIGRLVFYEQSSLDEWLKLKRRRSTSDPGPPPKRH